MTQLFISHSSQDDAFVRKLQQALADQGQDVWIDSRELRGGDPLWLEIKKAIAEGKRVGDAMLAGQRQLKDDTCRGRIFGAGELRLEDWFVPVLFQEKDDPQLFKTTPAKQTRADFQTALAARLGELPKEPDTGFVGRSRELLALQRLLLPSPLVGEGLRVRGSRYAVVRGQGGEGKTALSAYPTWL